MSDRYGIPGMLVRIGIGQAVIIVLTIVGGRALWSFGLRVESKREPSSVFEPVA
jgi:hypothetical protein